MNGALYPLFFEPVFRQYMWGGRELETLLGRALPPGIVAESWEISGHPSSPTVVANGPFRGRSLPDLVSALGVDLVGSVAVSRLDAAARERFPLLVKLLDANQDLSLQVHPDDAYARAHAGGELGKTEMWYILHAQPGAAIIYGLAAGSTRVSFLEALRTNSLETQLQRIQVAAGDCIYIPAGTLHALLAGVLAAEIQQNSDTTYRVSDWGRVGPDGQPRALHLEQALQVINYQQIEPGKVQPQALREEAGRRVERLITCPQFVVERVTLEAGAEYAGRCDGATFELWGCMKGACQLHWADRGVQTTTGDSGIAPLHAVRFALLPAALGAYALRAERTSTLLRAFLA